MVLSGMASRTARPMGSPTVNSIPIRRLLMARIHHMVRASLRRPRSDMERTPSVEWRSGSVLQYRCRLLSFGLILGISASSSGHRNARRQ